MKIVFKAIILTISTLALLPIAHAQDKLYYSPDIYKQMVAAYESANLKLGTDKLSKSVRYEVLKMMALTPSSKASKINAIGACALKKGYLKSSELGLINNFLKMEVAGDLSGSLKAISAMRNCKPSSAIMSEIVRQLNTESSGSTPHTATENESSPAPSGNIDGSTIDDIGDAVEDVIEAEGVVFGAITGAIAGAEGGPAGAIAGAGVGAQIGKAVGEAAASVWRAVYNFLFKKKEDGVIAGPNGEDCQEPFTLPSTEGLPSLPPPRN